MTKKLSLPVLAIASACFALHAGAIAAPAAKATTANAQPKLVVVLVIDGLPNEQVQRYRDQFGEGGFRRLLDQGVIQQRAPGARRDRHRDRPQRRADRRLPLRPRHHRQ